MGEHSPIAGRWIGLDISSTTSGWAVVDAAGPTLVASGIIKMSRRPKDTIGIRLERLFFELGPVLLEHRPCRAVLEAGYLKWGISMLVIAEARGVALLVCQGAGIRVDEVPPSTLKLEIGGHGHSDKDRMEAAVRRLCRGCPDSFASDDESDAVSCALYGALVLQPQKCPI